MNNLWQKSTIAQQAEAHGQIVEWMLRRTRGVIAKYGYEVYLETVILEVFHQVPPHQQSELLFSKMAAFADAAADLCRRGILRQSVLVRGPGYDDGLGYSITPQGEAWLAEAKKDPFIAMEPTQFADMLAKHRNRFGDGFHERAQEAVKGYRSTAYLSCCAMCGAAAESILLAVAFAKEERNAVHKRYMASGGRGRIQASVLAPATDGVRAEATAGLSLLKYWRDDAAHGGASGVTEATAFTSIVLLVRLAALFDDNWSKLTAT